MGIMHLFFVLLNFRTLGRLGARINWKHPSVVDQLWEQQPFARKFDVVFGSAVFSKRAVLLNFAVVNPEKLPVYLLGDDQIAEQIQKLNAGKAASIYRFFCKMSGYD